MNRPDETATEELGPPRPLSTRAAPPRPRRLSRKAIALLAGAGLIAIAGSLAYSLSRTGHSRDGKETVSVERPQSDLLASAPRDYGDLAKADAAEIGPPPSEHVGQASAVSPDAPASSAIREADAAAQRRQQQAESARASKLFAGTADRFSGQTREDASPPLPGPVQQPESGSATTRDRHLAFLAGGTRGPTQNSGRMTDGAGPNVLAAGSTIAAALITGLSSDLPGAVIAQVTEDVFDSSTGRVKLIPQGARLIGSYDANVNFGQSRALVVWTRLLLPDGRSIDLDRLVGTDSSGKSGFADRVDHHWAMMFKAGLLSTLLGLGAAASELDEDGQIANAVRDSAGQTIGRAGDRIVEKQLGVQPTITIRPGTRVRVLVSRDLILGPWSRD